MKGRSIKIYIVAILLVGSLSANYFIDQKLNPATDTSVNVEVVVPSDDIVDEEQSTSYKVLDLQLISTILDKIIEISDIF